MSELKNCPFCGGKATVEYDLEVYAVVCRECGASSRTEDDWHVGDSAYADVVAAWNSRADHLPDATKMVSNADRIRSMSIGEAMNCPKCNSANIYTPAENLFICNRCGHEWQAEVEGRAVVLPCKVGDTVWINFTPKHPANPEHKGKWFTREAEIERVKIGVKGLSFQTYLKSFALSELGKTVFLTRAAAEQAKGERE